MFVKSLFLCAVTLSLSLQVHGHATFAPNQAAADALKKSDIKRAPNPCVAATALKNPIPVDANGQFVAFARSFDAGTDGATTIKAGQVDASAVGTTFKDGDVTEVSGGVASQPDNKGRQTVTFAMPQGVKCAGGSDKSSCLVSLTTSAGFVNCLAVTQAGSNSGAGTKAAGGNKQGTGNKQAASSSSADSTATSTSTATDATSTATSTSTSSGANQTGNAGSGSGNSGGASSDSQASQQVTEALKQVQKIQQELDALIKSLGGNNNNQQANKNAAAKKAAGAKKAGSQNNNSGSATSAASGAAGAATPPSTGADAASSNVTRDLAEDNEDDAELTTRDLEDDEDVDDELTTRDLEEDEDDADELNTRDLEDDEDVETDEE